MISNTVNRIVPRFFMLLQEPVLRELSKRYIPGPTDALPLLGGRTLPQCHIRYYPTASYLTCLAAFLTMNR